MDNLDINDDKDSENFFEEDVTDQDLNSVLDKIENETDLSEGQKARMQKNKLKALALKKARLLSNPYDKEKSKKRSQTGTKVIDSGGGFFIEENEEADTDGRIEIIEQPPPILPPDQPTCEDCNRDFAESYLFNTFEHSVCDECRNMERDGPHELITKTDAKKQFLITDAHLEREGRNLKFLLRKNPHNPRYGDMKLFLRLQIEKLALEIWGSEEELEAEIEKREANKIVLKEKKYNKKMKELRKAVRSSLFTKDFSTHSHTYGEETYDEDKDEYSKVCTECGQVLTYEKM